jgi:hypothetical protein
MTRSRRDLTLAKIREFHGEVALRTWLSIETWAKTKPNLDIRYGGGEHDDAINIVHVPSGLTILTTWGYQKTAKVEIEFEYLKQKQPFTRLTERKLYADRLAAVRPISERGHSRRKTLGSGQGRPAARTRSFADSTTVGLGPGT